MNTPSLMLAAPASGSGKTLLTCGLLQVLLNQKLNIVSFKCGPDYIDPMFHTEVLGTKCRNLDLFLSSEETVRYLFSRHAKEADLALLEGVMGYYDGVGNSTWGSAYELAGTIGAPVVLVIFMCCSKNLVNQGFFGISPSFPYQRGDFKPTLPHAL